MRVLVTGSARVHRLRALPGPGRAGHEVVGLDTVLLRRVRLRRISPPSRRIARDVRDVRPEHLEGFDAVVHLAALSNDPLGDLRPELDLRHQSRRNGLARPRREGRRGRSFRLRVVVLDVRRRRRGRCCSPRMPRCARSRAYAESKVRAEEGLVGLDGDGFATVSMRNATVYGVSPRLRLDIVLNNLAGMEPHDGPDPTPERRHVMAAAPARAGPRQGSAGDPPGAGIARLRTRPSTSGPPRRTTSCETLPKYSQRSRGARSSSPATRRPTPAPIASTSLRSGGLSPPSSSTGTRRPGRRSSSTHTGRLASPRRRSMAVHTSGFGSCGTSSTRTPSTPTFGGYAG